MHPGAVGLAIATVHRGLNVELELLSASLVDEGTSRPNDSG
jgi:hypothetical protein